jgi:tetratricopeptide (TPR) repeat protein
MRAGQMSDALAFLDEALEMFTAIGNFRHYVWAAQAEVCVYAGRLAEARDLATRTLSWARERGYRGWAPIVDHHLGLAATRSDPPDLAQAEQHLRRARETAGEFGRRPLVARCHLILAELYGKVGKREQGHDHLSTATAMFSDMGMRFWLRQADAERHRLEYG